jgi:predicted DNA-binding transcriptional regulator YafY
MTNSRRNRPKPVTPVADRPGVTPERFARLYRLLKLMAEKQLGRDALARKLALDVRGFYRDLGVLRSAGIDVTLTKGRYCLEGDFDEAVVRLPFPDPLLTLGEARLLAKGKSAAHKRLRDELARAGV